jgi:hypothetical protein
MSIEIKKTMVAVLAFVTENGNMSKDNLELFTSKFCVKASGSTGSREVTILKDIEGEQIGRKCSLTGLWFSNDSFSKNTTCVKLADAARGKRHGDARAMEAAAKSILAEAKELTDIADKVAKYEEYDAKLAEAQAHRGSEVIITDEMKEGGVETIEELAKALGVEVNPVKPVEPTEEASLDAIKED